jgi:hypothetical protein
LREAFRPRLDHSAGPEPKEAAAPCKPTAPQASTGQLPKRDERPGSGVILFPLDHVRAGTTTPGVVNQRSSAGFAGFGCVRSSQGAQCFTTRLDRIRWAIAALPLHPFLRDRLEAHRLALRELCPQGLHLCGEFRGNVSRHLRRNEWARRKIRVWGEGAIQPDAEFAREFEAGESLRGRALVVMYGYVAQTAAAADFAEDVPEGPRKLRSEPATRPAAPRRTARAPP